jgi:hypothetical protein
MKNVMADVRPNVGVPTIAAFANDAGTPIVVDTSTGDLYTLVGSAVTRSARVASSGSWTPTDASGALLTFTTLVAATYTHSNGVVTAAFAIQYPVTASGANAVIGGLPVTVGSSYGGGVPYTDAAVAIIVAPNPASTICTVVPTFGGGAITNLQLSGKIVICFLSYQS